MSDGSRVSKVVKNSLGKLFPKMHGHQASHYGTLIQMVTGMITSKHCHLPKLAGKIPSKTKRESQVVKFKRWLSNNNVTGDIFFLPFLMRLLPFLIINQAVEIIIDGSVVGRNSACLMASIVYKNRVIPIAWYMGEGRKGHFSEEFHLELLKLSRLRRQLVTV